MEAIKLKIFDVLTEKISLSEFENWLYSSEEFMSQINTNSFCFDVISVNYRDEDWLLILNNLAKKHLDNDYLEILKIKKSCLSIIESETFDETHKMLSASVRGFDYDTDYSILWKFSHFKDYFNLVKEGLCDKGTLEIEIKFLSKKTIESIKKFNTFEELKTALEENLKPFKSSKIESKQTLTEKIFAFFKKI